MGETNSVGEGGVDVNVLFSWCIEETLALAFDLTIPP